MKEWTKPELKELEIKNTEVNTLSGSEPDGSVYDLQGNYVKPCFSY